MSAEEERLTAEWNEARRRMIALQLELDHPAASRAYDAQMKLLQELKTAKDDCYNRLVALRAYRKASGDHGHVGR